jgi:hypothetical protein
MLIIYGAIQKITQNTTISIIFWQNVLGCRMRSKSISIQHLTLKIYGVFNDYGFSIKLSHMKSGREWSFEYFRKYFRGNIWSGIWKNFMHQVVMTIFYPSVGVVVEPSFMFYLCFRSFFTNSNIQNLLTYLTMNIGGIKSWNCNFDYFENVKEPVIMLRKYQQHHIVNPKKESIKKAICCFKL